MRNEMTNEQRKAMFARMRTKLSDQHVLKRAAIGVAMAGTGAAIAYKNPKLIKQAVGLMTAGGTIAAGYGGRAYQTVKDEAEKRGHSAQQKARQWKDFAVSEGQRKGGDAVASAIDYPFSWAEGMAAGGMDRRMRNIEAVLAKRLGTLQGHLTGSAVEKVSKLSGMKLGVTKAMEQRTKLRRELENKNWKGIMEDMQRSAMRSGQQFYVHSQNELADFMTKRTIPVTEANKAKAYAWWYKMITPHHTMGDSGDFTGA